MIVGSDGKERKIIRVAKDEVRDAVKKKEDIMYQETKILQKINKAHREGFKERFPGQIEHCMRLTVDLLHSVLAKKSANFDHADTSTWAATPEEILQLSHGLYYLSIMNQHYPVEGE